MSIKQKENKLQADKEETVQPMLSHADGIYDLIFKRGVVTFDDVDSAEHLSYLSKRSTEGTYFSLCSTGSIHLDPALTPFTVRVRQYKQADSWFATCPEFLSSQTLDLVVSTDSEVATAFELYIADYLYVVYTMFVAQKEQTADSWAIANERKQMLGLSASILKGMAPGFQLPTRFIFHDFVVPKVEKKVYVTNCEHTPHVNIDGPHVDCTNDIMLLPTEPLAYQATETAHCGQAKLLVMETEFILQAFEKDKKPTAVLYLGSAPGYHIKYLVKQFHTKLQFFAVDPKPTVPIKGLTTLPFPLEDYGAFYGHRVLVISDIWSDNAKPLVDGYVTSLNEVSVVVGLMEKQFVQWFCTDITTVRRGARLYGQPYLKGSSTEMRAITWSYTKETDIFPSRLLEYRVNHYRQVIRPSIGFKVPLTSCGCWDCRLMDAVRQRSEKFTGDRWFAKGIGDLISRSYTKDPIFIPFVRKYSLHHMRNYYVSLGAEVPFVRKKGTKLAVRFIDKQTKSFSLNFFGYVTVYTAAFAMDQKHVPVFKQVGQELLILNDGKLLLKPPLYYADKEVWVKYHGRHVHITAGLKPSCPNCKVKGDYPGVASFYTGANYLPCGCGFFVVKKCALTELTAKVIEAVV